MHTSTRSIWGVSDPRGRLAAHPSYRGSPHGAPLVWPIPPPQEVRRCPFSGVDRRTVPRQLTVVCPPLSLVVIHLRAHCAQVFLLSVSASPATEALRKTKTHTYVPVLPPNSLGNLRKETLVSRFAIARRPSQTRGWNVRRSGFTTHPPSAGRSVHGPVVGRCRRRLSLWYIR
jgi:hypothetical protein